MRLGARRSPPSRRCSCPNGPIGIASCRRLRLNRACGTPVACRIWPRSWTRFRPDSPYERVVLQKSAQAGGTEVGSQLACAIIVCHAPGLLLLVMPSLDMARRNTRTRIDPMIESMPALRERISAARSRDAYNSRLQQKFSGRHVGDDRRQLGRGAALDPKLVIYFWTKRWLSGRC